MPRSLRPLRTQCYSSFRICLAGFPVPTGKPLPHKLLSTIDWYLGGKVFFFFFVLIRVFFFFFFFGLLRVAGQLLAEKIREVGTLIWKFPALSDVASRSLPPCAGKAALETGSFLASSSLPHVHLFVPWHPPRLNPRP